MIKFIYLLSILLVFLSTAYAQRATLQELRTQLKDDDFGHFAQAIAENDVKKVYTFLNPSIDHKPLEKVFGIIASKYNHFTWDIERHFTRNYIPLTVFEYGSNTNIIIVNRYWNNTFNRCIFTYTFHIEDSTARINSLQIKSEQGWFDQVIVPAAWKEFQKIAPLFYQTKDSTYEYLRMLEKEYTPIYKSLAKYKSDFFKEGKLKQNLATCYFDLSWYALTRRKFKDAKNSALRSLKLNPSAEGAKANLAIAYLFTDQYEKASTIYAELKDKKYEDGRTYKEIFIEDISTLEAKGIKNQYFDTIKDVLQN